MSASTASRQGHAGPNAGTIAALLQIIGPMDKKERAGLIGVVSKINDPAAAKALVKIILFDPDDDLRDQALQALRECKSAEYVEELMRGFRHPWPIVALRAAQTMVRLGLSDAVPSLIDFLDEPNPAGPFNVSILGKKLSVVREVVRVNHHRNCQLCHAPADFSDRSERDTLMARVPSPAQQLPPSLSPTYYSLNPREIDLIVRADVTYLRQDFSLMQKVPAAAPWPEMQRFDFFVRLRTLSDAENAERANKPTPATSPQHLFALAALRELTWQDHGPTAAAWRRADPAYLQRNSKSAGTP